MALITCSECGKQYSNKAPACPNCACPTPGWKVSAIQAETSSSISKEEPAIDSSQEKLPDKKENKGSSKIWILAVAIFTILFVIYFGNSNTSNTASLGSKTFLSFLKNSEDSEKALSNYFGMPDEVEDYSTYSKIWFKDIEFAGYSGTVYARVTKNGTVSRFGWYTTYNVNVDTIKNAVTNALKTEPSGSGSNSQATQSFVWNYKGKVIELDVFNNGDVQIGWEK